MHNQEDIRWKKGLHIFHRISSWLYMADAISEKGAKRPSSWHVWKEADAISEKRAERASSWHVWKEAPSRRHGKSRPFEMDGFACDHSRFYYYSAEIAPVGQAASHAPQSTHASASISYLPSPSEIAPTGHSLSQEPQLTHSSLITCAIV